MFVLADIRQKLREKNCCSWDLAHVRYFNWTQILRGIMTLDLQVQKTSEKPSLASSFLKVNSQWERSNEIYKNNKTTLFQIFDQCQCLRQNWKAWVGEEMSQTSREEAHCYDLHKCVSLSLMRHTRSDTTCSSCEVVILWKRLLGVRLTRQWKTSGSNDVLGLWWSDGSEDWLRLQADSFYAGETRHKKHLFVYTAPHCDTSHL